MNRARLLLGSLTVAAAGVVVGRASAAATIARLRAGLAHADHHARHDPLTGVLNRAGLRQHFATSRPGTLILLDLDGFKSVNDRHGHPVGDQLLSAFAARLATAAGAHAGVAGRLGGDEFVALLPDTADPDTAIAGILAALHRPVRPTRLDVALLLPVSAGACIIRTGLSWSQALRQADVALYQAKTGRRPAATGQSWPSVVDPRPPGAS